MPLALCGLAFRIEWLVIARAFQGIGGAMLFSNAPAIITKSFPCGQRGQALGLQATMTYLGLAAGPSFGGWLTTTFGWRVVFYINVPIGTLVFLLGLLFITNDSPEESGVKKFDIPGAVLFSAGLVMLLLALNRGHEWGWDSPLNYICLYFGVFLMPFYLIQGRRFSPAEAGLLLTAQPLVMAVAAPVSGFLSDRIGSRFLSTIGMLVMMVGLFLLSGFMPGTGHFEIVLGLSVTGLGTCIFISPNTSALMGSAPRERQGIAAGILATARNVGMVLGVGLAGAVFSSITSKGGPEQLFPAIHVSFLVAGGIAAAGAIVSFIRGKTTVK
ncbi:MAG: MFS transporter [Spirochaetales bacterium]|nr:MFS transporter [Spirochaetales bacterium]